MKGIGLNLSKYLVFLVTVCCLQFLLDEPRAVLIAAELNNMSVNVLFRLVICYMEVKVNELG